MRGSLRRPRRSSPPPRHDDLRTGRAFRSGLRVKAVKGSPGVFEMIWAPDGWATFRFGPPVRPGDVHVIWRRIGTHEVFRES